MLVLQLPQLIKYQQPKDQFFGWSFLYAISMLSMNNKVTVTGMEVTTKVSSNLFIAPSTASNNKADDNTFKSAYHQTATGKVQPSSSIDGVNFFYTYDASADGQILSGYNYQAVSSNTINDGTEDLVAYVDQVFEVKATNTSADTQYVNLTKLNVLYNGAVASETGYRVAVFVQKQADTTTQLGTGSVNDAYAAIAGKADSIFGWDTDGSEYFTTKQAVKQTSGATAADNLATVENYATAISLEVGGGETQYFKITVRMWLEGEDKTCKTSTYVDLTDAWALDMEFTFENATTNAVEQIDTDVNTSSSYASGKLTATLTNGETAKSYAWYKDGSAVADATASEYATTTAGDYYCVITTVKGNVYKTATVTVTAD